MRSDRMNLLKNLFIHPLGDHAITFQLSEEIDDTIHVFILQITEQIEVNPFSGFIEAIPGYNNFTLFYDSYRVFLTYINNEKFSTFYFVKNYCIKLMKQIDLNKTTDKNIINIPIFYGDEQGPDLQYVATYNQITAEQVIKLHNEKLYLVYMIGFAPGFPYFGNIHENIVTPRKEKPRQHVPAGSVGIAGNQTGIYTLPSPGGWQIIGNTPKQLFTPEADSPSLLSPGDYVQFKQITKEQFTILQKENEYGD